MSLSIAIQGNLAVVTFDRFDLDTYQLFLRAKRLPESQIGYDWENDRYQLTTPARFAGALGADIPAVDRAPLSVAEHLFDYQRWALGQALEARRFALWLDTGLGKTMVYLEWARQVLAMTGGRVLILAPLAIIPQVQEESKSFYGDALPIEHLRTRDELIVWCESGMGVGICNYEKFIPGVIPELRLVAGLIADECFVAGTPVDTPDGPQPIESIQPGDRVLNAVGIDTVMATTSRTANRVVVVHVDNRQGIINSENHPYLTRRGWVRAVDLQPGDELVTQSEAMRVLRDDVPAKDGADALLLAELRCEMAAATAGVAQPGRDMDRHGNQSPAPMYVVWPGDDPRGFEYAVLQPVVRSQVSDVTAGCAREDHGTPAGITVPEATSDPDMRTVWIDLRRSQQAPDPTVLQSPLLSHMAYAAAGDSGEGSQPDGCSETRCDETCLVCDGQSGSGSRAATDRIVESDAQSRDPRESQCDPASDGSPTTLAWRKGSRYHEASAVAVGGVGRGLGVRVLDPCEATAERSAVGGVHRHCASGVDDRHRSGRDEPPHTDLAGPGQTENRAPRINRVDRIEILESDDPRLAGHRDPDGQIILYDLEIANHPSFSVHGLLVHNSSVLRKGGGVIKWNLIKSARGIEYKLSCTATPVPNEAMEYASQAAFLEKLRSEGDILWTYFQRDKYGTWTVKPHARDAFYRFMASWSVYLRNPVVFGFEDILASLPDPEIVEERIPITRDQQALLDEIRTAHGIGFLTDERISVTLRQQMLEIARGFRYVTTGKKRTIERIPSAKPFRVAEMVTDAATAGPVLVWTTFDAEADIIHELLPPELGAAVLTGSMAPEARVAVLEHFRAGELQVLISKPQLIGYGLNLQFVRTMVFSGFDDSFERLYQAIRRAYRFGQTEIVRVLIPYVPELEGMVFDNLKRKEVRFLAEVAGQEAAYRVALAGVPDREAA